MENVEKVVLNSGAIWYKGLGSNEDFELAQEILDVSEYTSKFNIYDAFEPRITNQFDGTFEVSVDRQSDYEDLVQMVEKHMTHPERYDLYYAERSRARDLRDRGFFSPKMDFWDYMHEVVGPRILVPNCDCKKCTFELPTFENWKNNTYTIGKNIGKLSKVLGRTFGKEVLDFYTQQVKDEKQVYLTITSAPQFIVGMSYFAEMDSWDGYEGTSCQDPRHDTDMAENLAGSAHDNTLFVGLLHSSLEDLDDMTDRLLARVVFRYFELDDIPVLVPTTYYGNNKTKDLLHNALELLSEVNVYSNNVLDGEDELTMKANGAYDYVLMVEEEISITKEVEHEVECPICEGTGTYEVEIRRWVNRTIECPHCEGTRTHTVYDYIELEKTVEVESERDTIYPYSEYYSHRGRFTRMYLKTHVIRELREQNDLIARENEMRTMTYPVPFSSPEVLNDAMQNERLIDYIIGVNNGTMALDEEEYTVTNDSYLDVVVASNKVLLSVADEGTKYQFEEAEYRANVLYIEQKFGAEDLMKI